jgi:hypothetical protein
MLCAAMANPGSYKVLGRARPFDALLDPELRSAQRTRRILESLRSEIVGAEGEGAVRVRRILERPRELFRIEIDSPELGYQRTTLLDRRAFDELLRTEEVRARVRVPPS